ncbi:quinone-dependent dihydroorotate dehydrogenase [Sphingomonas sp.]|uniref:quinone-dependent dihydroorotate dehydrogenase n=1 Tax=Sphingomonas sp. TaxID=28214 RepID=UPI0025ED6879|nr:quinone-dependent dihydroorotate dehydrogenase [Sphingomonas sp.]MBV9528789.1 quinone-dependent dihydroorotate dehydrogenase [Sphingomonas sp.]
MALYPFLRPLVFRIDAEKAHRATIAALKLRTGTGFTPEPPWTPTLRTEVAGLDFWNPIGLAAGFDKDAEVPEQMLGLGFGFVEVGTVTPRPQEGNPKPRLFRLAEDEAVINRMGFNNAGQEAALGRLRKRYRTAGLVGVNVGANKSSMATGRGVGRQDGLSDGIADYVAGVRAMSPVADYVTINISSPNTPGLRGLQDEGALEELLAAVRGVGTDKPVFLKVAPDLGEGDPERIVRAAIDHGVAAIIVSNTTVSRPQLKSRFVGEAGGLSGRPLKPLALDALRRFRRASGGDIPLIGVGGIASADDAWERIRAGASLIQLYSAMVYTGPGIARRIARGLADRLKREGFANIADAVGTEA